VVKKWVTVSEGLDPGYGSVSFRLILSHGPAAPHQPVNSRGFSTLAGLPPTIMPGGTSAKTAALAPTTARLPTVTPGPTKASAAIQQSAPTTMGGRSSGYSGKR
jgi:hypothetical protein